MENIMVEYSYGVVAPTNIKELVKKAFPHYKGEELCNTDVLQTENYLFIATHCKIEGHFLQQYYLMAVYKHLFNEIVYSDGNCIDNNKYMTALKVKENTTHYLSHLLKEIG